MGHRTQAEHSIKLPEPRAPRIVLLFYFFISAAILLFGAELNSEVYREAAEEEEVGERI